MQRKSEHNIQATHDLVEMLNAENLNILEVDLSLLDKGADPNVKNKFGDGILHLLMDSFSINPDDSYRKVEDLVLNYGSDIHICDNRNLTPIKRLLETSEKWGKQLYQWQWIPIQMVPWLMKLIYLGADPKTQNAQGMPILHLMVREVENIQTINEKELVDDTIFTIYNNIENYLADLITKYGVDIHSLDSKGETVAHIRCQNIPSQCPQRTYFIHKDRKDRMMNLIRLGASTDLKNADGLPLLHLFSDVTVSDDLSRFSEMVTQYNANIEVKDQNGLTVFQKIMADLSFQGGQNDNRTSKSLDFCLELLKLGADYSLKHPVTNESFFDIIQKNKKSPNFTIGLRTKLIDCEKLIIDDLQKTKNQFISNLILFVRAKYNLQNDKPLLINIPEELLLYIISLSFPKNTEIQAECLALAKFFFSLPKETFFSLKNHGMKVCQFSKPVTTSGQLSYGFRIFEKVEDFCEDYPSFKEEIKNKQVRANPITDKILGKELTNTSVKAIQDRALNVWHSHSSIFNSKFDKINLWNSIKDKPPYSDPVIQAKIQNELQNSEVVHGFSTKKS